MNAAPRHFTRDILKWAGSRTVESVHIGLALGVLAWAALVYAGVLAFHYRVAFKDSLNALLLVAAISLSATLAWIWAVLKSAIRRSQASRVALFLASVLCAPFLLYFIVVLRDLVTVVLRIGR